METVEVSSETETGGFHDYVREFQESLNPSDYHTELARPQVWVGVEAPQEEETTPVRNRTRPIGKPYRGFWTSSLNREGEYITDWMRYATERELDTFYSSTSRLRAYLMVPKDDISLYEVDDLHDLEQLTRMFPFPTHPHCDYNSTIDYEAMNEMDFDGIHLTKDGMYDTESTWWHRPELSGWDCESTLWFDWCFEKAIPLEGWEP